MDLERISSAWEEAVKQGVLPAANIRRLSADVCVFELKDGRLCFTFGFGSVVAWGLDTNEMRRVRRLIRRSISDPLPSHDVVEDWLSFSGAAAEGAQSKSIEQFEAEFFQPDPSMSSYTQQSDNPFFQQGPMVLYREVATPTKPLQNDHLRLTTRTVDEALAYSYAFAQSVKLAVFEKFVDAAIERAKPIPESLATYGTVDMDDKLVKMQMGTIFVTKCSMTLQTDILDTPEIIWENDRFDEQYNVGRKYLELGKRIDILNQRLTVLNDLYSFLQAQLEVKHSNKLEWIIIWLIVVEILVEMFHMSPWYSKRSATICAGLLLMSGAVGLRGQAGKYRPPHRVRQLFAWARARGWKPLTWFALLYGAMLTLRGLLSRSIATVA